MVSQTTEKIEYTSLEEKTMEIMINEGNNQDKLKRLSFIENPQKKRIYKFSQKGYEETYGEMI